MWYLCKSEKEEFVSLKKGIDVVWQRDNERR